MTDPVIIPPRAELERGASQLPDFMRPYASPMAVIYEGYLSDNVCDELVSCIDREPGYGVARCGATTRQYERERSSHPIILGPISRLTRRTNEEWWRYAIDNEPVAWLQTYQAGGDYKVHMDASPFYSRKLTAVAMVSDPADYDGGDLTIRAVPEVATFTIPRTRGTVVVFQPWLLHDVSRVTRGVRRTVNLGYFGPPLR